MKGRFWRGVNNKNQLLYKLYNNREIEGAIFYLGALDEKVKVVCNVAKNDKFKVS